MVKNLFSYKFIIILLIFILASIYYNKNINNFQKIKKNKNLYDNKFAIIIRRKMSTGGILAYYYTHLGCVLHYLINGYIPIIDLISHPNIFNGFNTNISENPWERFFNQPFGYTLENVKKNAKNFEYIECNSRIKRPYFEVYYNFISKIFWQNIANKYTPIKDEIIKEANKYFKKLFKNKNNILGVLIRGTDYTAKKPYNHAIQPSPEMVLEDVKKMDQENKYDWIFVTTEDDLIREKFILNIGKKLKYIKSNKNINYDYNKKELLAFNKNISGNHLYMKIYLINILILSKCLDIITSKTAGSIVAFILNKKFRNIKVYELGFYK